MRISVFINVWGTFKRFPEIRDVLLYKKIGFPSIKKEICPVFRSSGQTHTTDIMNLIAAGNNA